MFASSPAPVTSISPLYAHALQSAEYVILDCETGNPTNADIQKAIDAKTAKLPELMSDGDIAQAVSDFAASWQPPARWKDDGKIEQKRQDDIAAYQNKLAAQRQEQIDKLNEASAKTIERAALLDSAPILCVCCKTDRVAVAFNGMDQQQYSIPDCVTLGCGDERTMLIALRDWLDQSTTPETQIVGHNLKSFDKPKLRNRYAVHRLRLPQILLPGNGDSFDTMLLASHYSVERNADRYISLDDTCAFLGIKRPKQTISGADVPKLHANGQHEIIITYCCIDCAATEQVFLLMTGRAGNLE